MLDGSGMTRNQALIWLGQEANPDLPVFNEMLVSVIDGVVRHDLFDRAVQAAIDATAALRTVFRRIDGAPVREVRRSMTHRTRLVDLSMAADPDAALSAWCSTHADLVLDLEERVFDSTLVKLGDERYAWAMLQHHIAADARSIHLVWDRVGTAYAQLRAGEEPRLPHDDSFEAYHAFELAAAASERFGEIEAFWKRRTTDPPPPPTFYDGRASARPEQLRRVRRTVELGAERTAALRSLLGRQGFRSLSPDLAGFSVMTAALLVYLHRVSGEKTIAVGVPLQNRRREHVDTIGLVMIQNPLIVSLDSGDSFHDVVRRVQREIVRSMRKLPYAAGNPGGRVYTVAMNYITVREEGPTFAGMPVRPFWQRPSVGLGSLDLHVHDFAGTAVSLTFDFNAAVFDELYRSAAIEHFTACLDACIADPTQSIDEFTITRVQDRRLVEEWNRTERSYPADRTVAELVRQVASDRATAVALTSDDGELTYGSLADRVDGLAARLRGLGVERGVRVGVCLHRSADLVATLLAVMRAGGTYVPMDPSFPSDRLAYMLDDSGARVVVTEPETAGVISVGDRSVLRVETVDSAEDAAEVEFPAVSPDDLAYVMYTSGSTGRPKGVAVPHRALTNLIWSMRAEPGCDADQVLLAVTTPSFDISALEMYLPLVVGGRVAIASRQTVVDGRLLRRRLETGDITMMQATPATWRMLVDAGWNGTAGLRALVGGEALPPDLAHELLQRAESVWNLYGPTETTIWSSVERITAADDEVTIGRPIANTTFHVVDERLRPVPVGLPGELCIGGHGLADGYLGRPDLTAARFVDASQVDPVLSGRVYRTGDLARFRPDGRVVHIGRLDDQVKIRGFRIELGEIEAVLMSVPGVSHAAVVVRDTGARGDTLVAYCVADDGAEPDSERVREELRRQLPGYMVPPLLEWLDALPLTPNAKVERKRLPSPVAPSPAARAAPRTDTERRIARMVASLLDVEGVGHDSDVFELGADSLLVVQLLSEIESELGVHLPLNSLLDGSTVADISDRVCEIAGAPRAGAGGSTDRNSETLASWSATQRRVAAVWSDVLGAPVRSLDDSFSVLQGDRDLRTEMLVSIRAEFGTLAEGLSGVDVQRSPTVADFAEILESRRSYVAGLVVPLQRAGTRTPMFLLHAAGGYVFFYRALAQRLGEDRPVYGVRAVTVEDNRAPILERARSVKRLAADYVNEIKAVQPDGPYLLGGASFGGVLAFEIANQLRAAGDRVDALVLFDAHVSDPRVADVDEAVAHYDVVTRRLLEYVPVPDGGKNRGHFDAVRAVGQIVRRPSVLRGVLIRGKHSISWRIQQTYLGQGLRQKLDAIRLRGASLTAVQDAATERSIHASLRMIRRYRPLPYDGDALLFTASHGFDPAPGWRAVIRGELAVHHSAGEHLEMLEEPDVATTARVVRAYLEAADQSVGGL